MIVSAALRIILCLSYCCDIWINCRAFMFNARKMTRIAISEVVPGDIVCHP